MVSDAGVIPVSEIVGLSGAAPVDAAQTAEGTALTGSEELKSKVTVRTRYPVDRLEVGDTVVTATGTKVDGAKLGKLVEAARSAGTELERI